MPDNGVLCSREGFVTSRIAGRDADSDSISLCWWSSLMDYLEQTSTTEEEEEEEEEEMRSGRGLGQNVGWAWA